MVARPLAFQPKKARTLGDILQELMQRDPQWVEQLRVLTEWHLKELNTQPHKVS